MSLSTVTRRDVDVYVEVELEKVGLLKMFREDRFANCRGSASQLGE